MKKLLVFAVCTLMLMGCKKEYRTPSEVYQTPERTLQNVPKCGNDLNPEFAAKMVKARRARDEQEIVNRRKPKDMPDPVSTNTVIYLDADGQIVENTIWNTTYNSSQPFNCEDGGLTADQMKTILKSVREDFSPFQITVTDDENLYNNTPKEKRVRVIITKHLGLKDIFPWAGGFGFIGSLWWKDDTPCFVFADVLLSFGLYPISVAETVSHETGHTIGLHHQSEYTFDGRFKYEYHGGFFSLPYNLNWAPIMGSSNAEMSGWMLGRNLQGIQNDTEMLSAVGVQADEVSNNFLTAKQLKFKGSSNRVLFRELLNKSSDADVYVVNSGNLKLSIIGGGNCDIKVIVYNGNEKVIAQFNDQNNIGISEKTIKTKGNRIYIKVLVNDLLIGDLQSEIQYAGQYTLVVNKG
jgi:hypothetical protein